MAKQTPKKQPKPVHQPGTGKGEEMLKRKGKEPGRYAAEASGSGRPTEKATGRSSSGAAPQKQIDKESPHIQAP